MGTENERRNVNSFTGFDDQHIYLGNAGGHDKPGFLYSIKAGAEGNITPADSGLVSN